MDCPFCGLQRSVISLYRGNLKDCFLYYPPLFPLLLSLIIIVYLKMHHKSAKAINYVLIADASIVFISCLIKNLISHC